MNILIIFISLSIKNILSIPVDSNDFLTEEYFINERIYKIYIKC